jgi:GTP cyclohydrolase I
VNAPERFFLPDMQASPDHRQLAIQQVGVKGLRYPLTLLDAAGGASIPPWPRWR